MQVLLHVVKYCLNDVLKSNNNLYHVNPLRIEIATPVFNCVG